jgi:hypothetical protein
LHHFYPLFFCRASAQKQNILTNNNPIPQIDNSAKLSKYELASGYLILPLNMPERRTQQELCFATLTLYFVQNRAVKSPRAGQAAQNKESGKSDEEMETD